MKSDQALAQLGLVDVAGGVTAGASGEEYAVMARIDTPAFLKTPEPLLLAPQDTQVSSPDGAGAPVSMLIVIADTPDLVVPVSQAVLSVLAVDDPSKVKVSTSAELAELRATIQGQLSDFGLGLIGIVFAVTAVLVASILFGLVTLRRKDFGRRRALGASQTTNRCPPAHPSGHTQRSRRFYRLCGINDGSAHRGRSATS